MKPEHNSARFYWLCLLWLLPAAQPAFAGAEEPYPEFVAHYDVRVNGLTVGYATFSLRREASDQYVYRSEAGTTGMASLFSSEKASETSRWRMHEGELQALEYKARRDKGDDDDNAHLVFDWDAGRVRNIGAGEHWEIEVPARTLDKMVMQLALLFDLRDGGRRFEYPVALRGRIKNYAFEKVGEERVELPIGEYDAVKLRRVDDDDDRSWIWSAPQLEYFPVRFLKEKSSGLKTDIVLRELEFDPA